MVKNRLLAVCGVVVLAASGSAAAAVTPPGATPLGVTQSGVEPVTSPVAPTDEQVFVEGSQLYAVGAEKNYVATHQGALVHGFADSTPGAQAVTAEQFVGTPVAWHGQDGDHVVVRTATGGLQHFSWDRTNPTERSAGFVAESDVAGDPAAAIMGGKYHVFYVSTAGHLMQRLWDPGAPEGIRGSSWTESASGEPVFVKGRPSVFEWNGQQHVFVRAADDTLAHFWWDPEVGSIQVGSWGQERTFADVTTLAGKDSQTVFYVNYAGQLKRATWHAEHGWEPEQNWSISEQGGGKGIVGRPQSFGLADGQHVFARHHDGSVTHFMKSAGTDVHRWEWLPPGTVDTDIAAALLNGDQDVFVTDRTGQQRHVWWSPAAQKTAHELWGDPLPAPHKPTLQAPAEPQLATAVVADKAVVGTRSNPDGSAQLMAVTSTGAVTQTPLRSGQAGDASARAVGLWPNGDGHTTVAIVSPTGDVTTQVQPAGAAPLAEPQLALIDALGPVASVPVVVDGQQARQFAVVTRSGMLTAVAAAGEPLQWHPILRSLDGLTPMVEMAPATGAVAVVFAQATSGQVLVAAVQGSQATWEAVPLLPGDQVVASQVTAAASAEGVLFVAAANAEGHVFANRTRGQGWLGWVQVGSVPTVGTPQVAVHPDSGQVVVVTRNTARHAVVSSSVDGAQFGEFAVAAHGGDEPPVFASEVQVVPVSVDGQLLPTVGVNDAGEVVPGLTAPASQVPQPPSATHAPDHPPGGAPAPPEGVLPRLPGRTAQPAPGASLGVFGAPGSTGGRLMVQGVTQSPILVGAGQVEGLTFPPKKSEGN